MLYRRVAWLLAAATGCGFDAGVIPGARGGDGGDAPVTIDAATTDGAIDVNIDASNCYGTFVSICLTAPPPAELAYATATVLDTDAGCTQIVAQTSGPALCVIAAGKIRVDAPVRASGSRALVLLATQSLQIGAQGMVDVGSFRDVAGPVTEIIGAAQASGALCGSPSAGGNDGGFTVGAGGGAGGSFGGRGGNGARGDNNGGGTAGESATAAATPTFVRGGCAGTSGGSGASNAGGKGAAGGGAVLLIAGASIANAGHIRACGMGGYGGAVLSGGGGGGSGGFIGLDAPSVANTGIVNANGGGGGEGGGGVEAGATANSATTGTTSAPGGTGNDNGGDGGAGSYGATLTGGAGATGSNGGGAGGGGAGVIRVFPAQTLAGTVSPPAS